MNAQKIRAGRFTVCLDTEKASDETYPNWVTFRLTRRRDGYEIDKASNMEGNGRTWKFIGQIIDGRLTLSQDRNNTITIACATLLARKFGLRYDSATVALFPNARIWTVRGNKSAAPTFLGRGRDKNRAIQHETAKAMTVAEMRARLSK